jgi:hypothetical protein
VDCGLIPGESRDSLAKDQAEPVCSNQDRWLQIGRLGFKGLRPAAGVAGDGFPAAALGGNTPDLTYLGRPGSVLDEIRPRS